MALKLRQWLSAVGAKTLSIEPGNPWENGYCESFNGKLRAQLQGKPLPYVYGVITMKDGKPASNARVTLHSNAHLSQVAAETRTGSDGYFEFWTVSPGGYLVTATPAEGGTPIKDSLGTGFPGVRLIMHDW